VSLLLLAILTLTVRSDDMLRTVSEKTVNERASLLTSLIKMLFRVIAIIDHTSTSDPPTYVFDIPSRLQGAVYSVMDSLAEDDEEGFRAALDDLMVTLLESPGEPFQLVDSPFERFICLVHMKEGGGFKPVSEVTRTLASVKWIIRSLLFTRYLRLYKIVPIQE
jgi:hypothetical protein